jgi:signal transduction histidine kinase/CheY-like chemotaxis protein
VYASAATTSSDQVVQMNLRGLETLRQLPVVVRHFDMEGHLLSQNPEANKSFGAAQNCHRSSTNEKDNPPKECCSTGNDPREEEETAPLPQQSSGLFLEQFLNARIGEKVLKEVQQGRDFQFNAQQCTIDGPKWFSIKVRRHKDPVTSNNVIIYSATDTSDIMQAAKEEADRSNMEKSEFFAVMAHEIRTPLHQVVGFIELLARTTLDAEQADFVSMLQSSTHALMAIINDLLDFTKLEGGKMTLEMIPFEARGVVEGCLAAVAHQAEEKGLQMNSTVASGIPVKLVGDPNRLRQILLNLLSNAIKFTSEGSIRLTVKRLAECDGDGRIVLRFKVEDTGIGISPQDVSRIFNAYQQADSSVSRNYGGTGLGLAICKDLVESMKGTIGVESEIGKGTTFWFEIPLERHAENHTLAVDNPASDDPALQITGLRILVAEDNKVNQKVVDAMLKRLGHFPTIVDNGQLAVDEIESRRDDYDMVLMDVQMPVMDGIDATKEIRNKGYGEYDLPIVGLTASIQNVDWNQIGMNDFLKKPIRMVDLKLSLAKHFITSKAQSPTAVHCAEELQEDADMKDPNNAESALCEIEGTVLAPADVNEDDGKEQKSNESNTMGIESVTPVIADKNTDDDSESLERQQRSKRRITLSQLPSKRTKQQLEDGI